MILGVRFLKDVASVNSYELAEVGEFTEGDVVSVYFQLIDTTLDKGNCGFNPAGRRYIPASGATLQCVVQNIDDSIKVTRFATNPFADDRSIWKLDFFATDKIRGTSNLKLTLTEGVNATRGLVQNGFRITPKDTL